MTGFYSHRKTARLRSALGDDALWLPPRLWAYAAENQPDGDVSGYTSEELAMLLGCSKHALSMLQALKDAGFVDEDGKIHDWDEHNGYHKKFSDRAAKAAAARWEKKTKTPPAPPSIHGNRKEERGDKQCLPLETSIACSMLEAFPSINTGDFKAVLASWLTYLTEKRKKPTPSTLKKQLEKLGAMSESDAIASINQSIENGWQGLFEPKKPANGYKQNKPTAVFHLSQ